MKRKEVQVIILILDKIKRTSQFFQEWSIFFIEYFIMIVEITLAIEAEKPYPPLFVRFNINYLIVAQSILHSIVGKGWSVIFHQSAFGRNPDEIIAVLFYPIDSVRWQSIGSGVMPDKRILSRYI